MSELWKYEHIYAEQGCKLVCGVDEAGRGPLAGPVCAAAVILPMDLEIEGLNDSKKLTEKRREALYDIIVDKALAYGIAFASEEEIDEINILQATFLAMRRAVEQLQLKPDMVLVDGNREPELELPVKTIVKGDSLSANIAAASILAKVTRDRLMVQLDETYPQYGFAVHKGYGTKAHYTALREHGMCPCHRKTFLKKFYANI
ncbi:MAG: ribonuclease HII [Ruminococcaceae bacterium]|nr:ribonuclease HII [Oscillospiraceae bacterium]